MIDKVNENRDKACGSFSNRFAQKMLFFLIGGGIGATVALLFAPKSGRELRGDIADAAGRSYDESIEAADRLKQRTAEYYRNAKEKGGEILDIFEDRLAAVKEEIGDDAARIGEILERPAKAA